MINDFRLREIGMDMMGYKFDNVEQLSFHHLIIPRRKCKALHIPNDGYCEWNGSILTQDKKVSAHDYLHLIERYDPDRFYAITSSLIDQNLRRQLLRESLLYINDILKGFESEYSGSGIIKPEYTRRRVVDTQPYIYIENNPTKRTR